MNNDDPFAQKIKTKDLNPDYSPTITYKNTITLSKRSLETILDDEFYEYIHPGQTSRQETTSKLFNLIQPHTKRVGKKSLRKKQKQKSPGLRSIKNKIIFNKIRPKYFSLDEKRSRIFFQKNGEKITYAFVHLPSPIDYEEMITLIESHLKNRDNNYGKSYHIFRNSQKEIVIDKFNKKQETLKKNKINEIIEC